MSESDHDAFKRPDLKLDGVPVAAPAPLAPAPAAPRPSRGPSRRPSTRLLVAGLGLVVLAVAVPVALTQDDSDDTAGATPTASADAAPITPPGEVFRAQVVNAYGAIGGVTNIYLTREIRRWRAGGSNAAARTALTAILPVVQRARALVDAVPPFEPAPTSLADYQASLVVYGQAVRLGLAATRLPDGGVQEQLRTQTLRLQNLGDRVFDQGTRDLDGFLTQQPVNDALIVQPPAEVPDFTNSGLLARAPLVPAPRSVVELEPPTGANQQAVTSWVAQVATADVPSAADVAAALNGTSATALGTIANRLSAAALRIRSFDDPASGRKDSTRVQLSLFVAAEAARAAEAAALVPAGTSKDELLVVSRTLAAQSDALWDSRLGPRDTGFPADLLTAK